MIEATTGGYETKVPELGFVEVCEMLPFGPRAANLKSRPSYLFMTRNSETKGWGTPEKGGAT